MRLNTAHGPLRRFATACFVIGLLSLIAAPLALAQSLTDDRTGGRSNDALVEQCPDGFQLTEDKSACYVNPVIITTQAPVACELGFLTPDASACYTNVQYVSQAPAEQIEVIDAFVELGTKANCPAGFTLTADLTCDRDDAPSPIEFEPAAELGDAVYVPASEDFAGGTCPAGTDPAVVQNGYCKIIDAPPLETLPGDVCAANEITGMVSLSPGHTKRVCYAALAMIPGTSVGISATCNGVPFSGTEAECIEANQVLTCPFGAVLGEADLCVEVSEVPALGQTTSRCPTGYLTVTQGLCSAQVAVPDQVAAPVTHVQQGPVVCADGSAPLPGNRCVNPDVPAEPGTYSVGTPGVAAVPGIPAVPPSCPEGTDPAITMDGMCAVLDGFASAVPEGGCPAGQIESPTSYASGQLQPLCLEALPQLPGTPAVPGVPGIPAIPSTCNGVPTTAPPSECFSFATTLPPIGGDPVVTAKCPGGFAPKNGGTQCSMPQPDVKVEVELQVVTSYDTAYCPAGYVGPSANLECTRTILTAQPDVPVCTTGTLLDIGNGFVCLLDNYPVAPPPVSLPSCPVGEYDAKADLCFWLLDTDPIVVDGPVTDTLPLAVAAFGDPADAPPTWVFNLASTCGDAVQFDVLTSDTFGGDAYQELPLTLEDAAGNPCTYTLTTVPFGDWESSLGLGGIEFTPAVTGVPFVFVQFEQADYAVIYVYKTLFGDAATVVTPIEITVSGICIDEPIVVQIAAADAQAGQQVEVPVVRTDELGNPCVYRVEHSAVDGLESVRPATEVVMTSAYTFVDFTKVQGGLDTGTIRITKTAEGDPAAAPESWEFIVHSYGCLEEQITVEIPAEPTFAEPVSVDIEVPYLLEGRSYPCDYHIDEVPVPGFSDGTNGYGTYASFYQGPLTEVTFHNTHLASATGSLTVYIDVPRSTEGDVAFTVVVESSCLDDALVFDRSGSDMYFYVDIDDLPLVDAAGEFCTYDASVIEADGFIATRTSDSTTLRGGYGSIFLLGLPLNETGLITIGKTATVVGDVELPEFWEFTVTSPCFDPIVVQMPVGDSFSNYGETLDVEVQVTDDVGVCEITVTETPVDGFAISPAVTHTTGGPYMFSVHEKVEAGLGLLGDMYITVNPRTAVELPESFAFALTSPCLDGPVAVDIPTSGADIGQPIDTIVPNLTVEADGALCGYSITPVAVDGLDFLISYGEPFLRPGGYNRIEITVGLEGAFDDAATDTIPAPVPPAPGPPVGPPTPAPEPDQPPAPAPAPQPAPAPAPAPQPAPGPQPAPAPVPQPVPAPAPAPAPGVQPAPVPIVASVPSTGVLVDAGQVNFAAPSPSTPAHMFGSSTTTTPKATGPIQALAHTGGNAAPLALFGILMILVGAMATVIARRDDPTLAVADPFWQPELDG